MWRAAATLLVFLLAAEAAAPAATKCRASPGDDGYYVWRSIDGKKCWYRGARRAPRANLYWEKPPRARPGTKEPEKLVVAPVPLILAHLMAAPGYLPPILAPVIMAAHWPETFGQRWAVPSAAKSAASPPRADWSAQFAVAAIIGGALVPALLGWAFFLWQEGRAGSGPVPRDWIPRQLAMSPPRILTSSRKIEDEGFTK